MSKITFDAKTKVDDREPDLLKIAYDRLAKFDPATWNTQDLLLMSIAMDTRQARILAQDGLKFSHDLAKEFDRP